MNSQATPISHSATDLRFDSSVVSAVAICMAGALVAVAGVLKLYAGLQDGREALGFTQQFGLPIGLLETAIGLLVISLYSYPRTTLSLALGFAGLAGFAGYRRWMGYSDCGCFGLISVPPAVTASVDLAMSALLLTCSWRQVGRWKGWLAPAVVGCVALGATASWLDQRWAGVCVVPAERLVGRSISDSADTASMLLWDPNCAKCAFVAELTPGEGAAILKINDVRATASQFHAAAVPDGCRVLVNGPTLLSVQAGRIVGVASVTRETVPEAFGRKQTDKPTQP